MSAVADGVIGRVVFAVNFTRRLRERWAAYQQGQISFAEFDSSVQGWINREFEGTFAWQSEYGAFTLGKHGLPRAIAYVQNQAEHHATGRIFKSVEPPDES